MKVDYKFSKILGTVYAGGNNLVFSPDSCSLITPVGSRVSILDLKNSKSHTLQAENARNIDRIAVSPSGVLLISVDDLGRALLINLARGSVLAHHSFKQRVRHICFSPGIYYHSLTYTDGSLFAVSHGNKCQVWKTPHLNKEFAPFQLSHSYSGHFDHIVSISWSPCSAFFITTSKDMTSRIYSAILVKGIISTYPDYVPVVLSGHRDTVIGAWFADESLNSVYSISKDGALIEWTRHDVSTVEHAAGDDQDELPPRNKKKKPASAAPRFSSSSVWKISNKHFFKQSRVSSASFHQPTGFASGTFGIYILPEFSCVHTLSISQAKIDAVAVDPLGEWIAFGCKSLGQVLVWEWKSESYILKQQGHHYDINTLSYSLDSQFIATGASDGKVKLWNAQSGFCFVTFAQHTASVTDASFSTSSGNASVLFTCSLDGTVRAFDLVRYRCFKTFTSPDPVQFNCLAIDPSGEVVCAASLDTFQVFVWSVVTGNLLDIYAGHEGPVASLSFSPAGDGKLASASWDKTVRVWDVFSRDVNVEVFSHESEVLCVSYRPDGKQLASATLGGSISFWDVDLGQVTRLIEGKKDLIQGRLSTSLTRAKNVHFNSITYSSTGDFIIAGGDSKFVCIYSIESQTLVKRFSLTSNTSFDGVKAKLNSRDMTEAGNLNRIQEADASDLEDRIDTTLPGQTRRKDPSDRSTPLIMRVSSVRFSPSGRSFACATTAGLVVYSLDHHLVFDPYDLALDVTPDSTRVKCDEQDWLTALVYSFRIGEPSLQSEVMSRITSDKQVVDLVVKDMPIKYLKRLMRFLVDYATGVRLEFAMIWISALISHHARYLKENNREYQSLLRALRKSVGEVYEEIGGVCDENTYTIRFLLQSLQQKKKQVKQEEKNAGSGAMEIDLGF